MITKNNSGTILLSALFIICICALLFSSCKKTSYPPLAIDKSYFPLITGKYIIYDVDSEGWNSFVVDTTDSNYHSESHYQIMEEVDSPYVDNAGNTAFRIVRSRRTNESDPWTITDIWSANLTDHTAEKVEENLRFIKLDFPVILNRQWFGNSKIQADSNLAFLNGWVYEYTSVFQPLSLNGLTFDSTVTVKEDLDSNAIQQYIYMEKYAKNVGMIYKYEDSLSTQPGYPKSGRILKMTAKEYN
jgi:hypothetical protein